MNSLNLNSNSPKETEEIGLALGKLLQPYDVVCLIGGLGAGKTALTRGLGQGWGTKLRVTSPTFTLINEYARPSDGRIMYHLDCYRLMSDDDVETIGLEDILAVEGVVVIEWPQVALDWLPSDYLTIELEVIGENDRHLKLIANGLRSETMIRQLSEVKKDVKK